jgi:phage antirepressor YoqD-like protein
MDFVRRYNGFDIRIKLQDNVAYFNILDVAYAAEFSRASSLRYHTKGKRRETVIDGAIYLTVKSMNKVAKDAIKTPGMKLFADWAKTTQVDLIFEANKPKSVAAPGFQLCVQDYTSQKGFQSKTSKKKVKLGVVTTPDIVKAAIVTEKLYGIKEAAIQLGMTAQQLSNWLVSEGYASRYKGNNALYWNAWFKTQGYGKRPVITDHKGQRESNVAKFTAKGLEFVKARLDSQRESNVLSFASKESNERVKLESEIDALIKNTFKGVKTQKEYSALLGIFDAEYFMKEAVLIKGVKAILAEVKLKEKANV